MAGSPQILGKFPDIDANKYLGNFINYEFANYEELNILNVGSPDCSEFNDIDNDIKSKTNVTGVDLGSMGFNKRCKSFKSTNFIQGSIFGVYDKLTQYDIVFNRWFLHHITTSQKQEFLSMCYDKLNENGVVVSIDYFIYDYETLDERADNIRKYVDYHNKKGTDNPLKKGKVEGRIVDLEKPDHRGLKFDSIEKYTQYAYDAGFKSSDVIIIEHKGIDDHKLFGHHMVIFKK